MALILILFGWLIGYGKSRYFPAHGFALGTQLQKQKKISRIMGYLLFLVAYMLLTKQFGWGTAIVIFFSLHIFALCLLLIVLSLHRKYGYVLGAFILLVILIENML
ncbi:hypothetical protein [Maribacter antarcticus]|uniref:hypothetical protein n=1 Tax=Maribacter antarcticus TaxID=505250 RepID=UPI00047ECAC1|nr:hypothetical protein [Maribacter antarcticus]